jgi:hypothetical protein
MEEGTKLAGSGLAVKNGGIEFGNMGTRLQKFGWDAGCLRPYFGKDGNAWKLVEETVQEASRVRTPAVDFLRGQGLSKTFSGFGKTIHKRQRRKEKTGAVRSMDALTQGRENAVRYDDVDTPLPITHDQFQLGMRQMAVGNGEDGADLQADNIFESSKNIKEDVESTLLTDVTFPRLTTQTEILLAWRKTGMIRGRRAKK